MLQCSIYSDYWKNSLLDLLPFEAREKKEGGIWTLLQRMAWCPLVRQSACSGKHKLWKFLLQINNPARSAVFNHRATAAGFISQGPHISNIVYGSLFNTFLGPSVTSNVKLTHSRLKNGFSIARRHFSSGYTDKGDDVEARLLGDDDNVDHREGIFTSGFGQGLGVDNGEYEYHDEQQQSNQWGDQAFGRSNENLESEGYKDSDDGMYDSDADVNVPSDQEFEAEDTDEELEELLADTPLFEPPEDQGDGQSMPEYSFRPEGRIYYPGMEYDPEDLDLSKPIEPRRREPREKASFSVQEVIDKADFRNVRFLSLFMGESGNILARKQFKMRNKSHGRITKAIKTARFFGLMPYTNMGRPKYVFNDPYDSDADFFESDDTYDEEGDTRTNTTEEREQRRYADPAGTETRLHRDVSARGRFDGRVGQNAQRSAFNGQGRWQR